jgi:hypothetical protein
LESLYVDLTDKYGCIVESPVVEPDRCYTSTNLLAEYVLRNLCKNTALADKVRAFLNAYPTDFYDYYQILFLRRFDLPFTTVEHVLVDTVNNIKIYHVRRTGNVMYDWVEYANLVAFKAILDITSGRLDQARRELERLSDLFNGYGFKDKVYQAIGKYEAYKLALAIIPNKSLGFSDRVDLYTSTLNRISPVTTLYTVDPSGNLVGEGDLNVETASLIAIALYSTIPYDIVHRIIPLEPVLERYIRIEYVNLIKSIINIAVILITLSYILGLLLRFRNRFRNRG